MQVTRKLKIYKIKGYIYIHAIFFLLKKNIKKQLVVIYADASIHPYFNISV